MQSIIVDDHGTKLSYIDSGVPRAGAIVSPHNYVTIFAIHGIVFTSPIFEKVMALAGGTGVRFVAINRRDYPGSTPLSVEDNTTLTSGTDEQKAAFLQARGIEFATFIDRFMDQNQLPPVSSGGDGSSKTGGFALVGWSLGCAFALATVSHLDALPAASQARWGERMRALILHEPPTATIGTTLPPQAWTPLADQTIQEDLRVPFFNNWITSYFTHGDLSTRDPKAISYVVPQTSRPPTIYSMSDDDLARIVYNEPALRSEMYFMVFSAVQISASYKKACYDKSIRGLVSHMRIVAFAGDMTSSFHYFALWDMEKDDEVNGGGLVEFKIVPGMNHFGHWADPTLTLNVYLAALE